MHFDARQQFKSISISHLLQDPIRTYHLITELPGRVALLPVSGGGKNIVPHIKIQLSAVFICLYFLATLSCLHV